MSIFTLPYFKLPQLLSHEVHVLGVHLGDLQASFKGLAAVLSEDEHLKVGRFFYERDRRCFAIARGMLRCLLAGYLSMHPKEIRFSYGKFGKPSLDSDFSKKDSNLCFNLSHAGDWVLYAFAKNREVGIDIESVSNPVPWRQLASEIFSLTEQAELTAFPQYQQKEVFLRGWTRKEAYLKGRGEGLFLPLNSFSVPLGLIKKPEPIISSDKEGITQWWFHPVSSIPGYIIALAVAGEPVRIRRIHWPALLDSTAPQRSALNQLEGLIAAATFDDIRTASAVAPSVVGKRGRERMFPCSISLIVE
jgi:4'-phosphopantetheinyl transferase